MTSDTPVTTTAPARKRRPVPPAMLRAPEAADYCGLGASTWHRLSAAGEVPEPRKVGGSVLWDRRELAAWSAHGCPPRAEWAPLWRSILSRCYGRAK